MEAQNQEETSTFQGFRTTPVRPGHQHHLTNALRVQVVDLATSLRASKVHVGRGP